MFDTRTAIAAGAVALALVGTVVSTGQAAAGDRRQLSQNVRFFNEAANGMLDGNGGGPSPITYPANGSAIQAWVLTSTAQGAFQIRNVYKNTLCLQAPSTSGDPILLIPCNANNPAQWWNLERSNDKVVITEFLDRNYVIESIGGFNSVVKAVSDHDELQEWDVLAA
ncbi:RICIN domain-containing protein [Kitasatospora sp. NPDC058162]|uniref:RICIN domain-containing protein n=1 Tax=Kitasatospora sp. NPDC058162 TaxID=3346362 RepID=UPI0036DA8EBC